MDLSKLGIRKRLEVFSSVSADGNIKVRYADLLEKETVFNEMLESLIDICIQGEAKIECYGKMGAISDCVNVAKPTVEKALYPKKWDEIKGLIC